MINETSDSPFPTSGATLGASGTAGGLSGSTSGSSLGSGTSASAAGMHAPGMQYQGAQGTVSPDAAVHRMARAAHEAVDRLEQALGSGSERMMDWQREYGEMARDQVRSNPLAAVGVAFGVGILFSKLFMR